MKHQRTHQIAQRFRLFPGREIDLDEFEAAPTTLDDLIAECSELGVSVRDCLMQAVNEEHVAPETWQVH